MADETGDVKKGTTSVGVQRRYSGTAGRVEDCQVAVFLTCAAPGGHAFVDRRLNLPESCICPSPGAPPRTAASWRGVPDDVAFSTEPALVSQMIESA